MESMGEATRKKRMRRETGWGREANMVIMRIGRASFSS
jgi:hypothetical protein